MIGSSGPEAYWEDRARRFATRGSGLAAVCSYGMPETYNQVIRLCQERSLDPVLRRTAPGARALDVGCGIGRWSRRLATLGATVTGIDLSPTMIAQAEERTERAGLGESCRFAVGDVTSLAVEGPFDLILVVTVLQHLDDAGLESAVDGLTAALAPAGRLVLLEAAPRQRRERCDSAVFRARGFPAYREALGDRGLRLVECRGVDPLPLRTLFLPWYRHLPPTLGRSAATLVSATSLPFDWMLGPVLAGPSWHKVMVFSRKLREA